MEDNFPLELLDEKKKKPNGDASRCDGMRLHFFCSPLSHLAVLFSAIGPGANDRGTIDELNRRRTVKPFMQKPCVIRTTQGLFIYY